eukprot:CAMPEP_0174856620 /NCGR_PEP_ID=MMETSP1114-20130205/36134_1 /TAXON_ID=312471 /ORGANISM="Neobodo designis, Strain CCAP 1951/1" /LENGTH=369 /DNA_ID=CAMNT_0016091425 /DNA_START=113 /DNA_END=1222 /DNA_ORIENTATION=-
MSKAIDAHIASKYEILDVDQPIENRTSGIIWRAVDCETKQHVALYKLLDTLAGDFTAQRTYREIEILSRVKHDDIANLLTYYVAETGHDVYLVFESLDGFMNLDAAIRGNRIPDADKPFIIYQLVKALKYMHSAGIAHRDLSPENVLVNIRERTLKVLYGVPRSVGGADDLPPVRMPGIAAGITDHTTLAADMWAVGSIVAELCTGQPLFDAEMRKVVRRGWAARVKDVARAHVPADAFDLLNRLLSADEVRLSDCLTAEQALEHPYVAQIRDPTNEPVAPSVVTLPLTDGLSMRFSAPQYRSLLVAGQAMTAADGATRRVAAACALEPRWSYCVAAALVAFILVAVLYPAATCGGLIGIIIFVVAFAW